MVSLICAGSHPAPPTRRQGTHARCHQTHVLHPLHYPPPARLRPYIIASRPTTCRLPLAARSKELRYVYPLPDQLFATWYYALTTVQRMRPDRPLNVRHVHTRPTTEHAGIHGRPRPSPPKGAPPARLLRGDSRGGQRRRRGGRVWRGRVLSGSCVVVVFGGWWGWR